jgi:hypothetical protein
MFISDSQNYKTLCNHYLVEKSFLEKQQSLEVSRQKLREQTLSRFKYVRTCVLARELCLLVRSNRVALEKEDVKQSCLFISNLCKESGCQEQSELCKKAIEALNNDEEKYLETCQQSCLKCGEAKNPANKKNTYVA